MTADSRVMTDVTRVTGLSRVSLDPSLRLVLLAIPHKGRDLSLERTLSIHTVIQMRPIRHWCGVQVSPHLSHLSLKPWQRMPWW